MNITLINQFYPPASAPTGRLLRDLARALSARGHNVTVMTSAGAYPTSGSSPLTGDDPGITVIRLGRACTHRTSLIAKAVDYLAFYRAVGQVLFRMDPPPDAVVCETTPPFIGLIAARLGRRRSIPYFIWSMDLYPEALVANGTIRADGMINRLLARLAARERRGARAVFTLGPDMRACVARDVAVRVCEVPVWSDLPCDDQAVAAARKLREQRGWGRDELILLYSGNMGRAHRADEFIALARYLREQRLRVRVVFCGEGPRRSAWEEAAGDAVTFMRLEADVPLAVHLLAADIHLISQDPAWLGVVVPSKFQSACALGRPVLFAGPPEAAVAMWIQEAGAGWIIPSDTVFDPQALLPDLLSQAERERRGRGAQALHERLFTASLNLDRLCTTLESRSQP